MRSVSTISITLSEGDEKGQNETGKKIVKGKEINLDNEISLESITGVGATTAQKLRSAGYETIIEVANADPEELSEKSGISNKIARKIIDAANNI
jgi:ERCC4-type nuclease